MNRRLLPVLASLLLAQLAMAAGPTTVASPPRKTSVEHVPTPPGTLPDARQILRDFLEASGGAKALDSMRNIVIDGTQSAPAMNISGPVHVYLARPNLLLVRGEIEGIGKVEQGYDGKIGWDINPMTGARLVEGAELDDIKRTFDETLGMSDLDKLYPTATTLGREPFEGKDAWKLLLGTPTGRSVTGYFDPVTKMQVGMEVKMPSVVGEIPATVTFEDYADFGGFKFPRKSRQTAMGVAMVTTFDSIRINVADFPTIAPPPEILALAATPADAVPGGE
jgi:hypothetical protein